MCGKVNELLTDFEFTGGINLDLTKSNESNSHRIWAHNFIQKVNKELIKLWILLYCIPSNLCFLHR